MAALILEVLSRELHHYHALELGDTRIGRAFDNDIILSDDTVSPHHLTICCTDDGDYLINESDENGTVCKGEKLSLGEHTVHLGQLLQLGRLDIRLLKPNSPVEKTNIHGCSNQWSCLFYSPFFAVLFTLLALSFFTYELNTFSIDALKITDLMTFAFGSLLAMFVAAGILSGLARMVSQYWDFLPAYIVSVIGLMLVEITPHMGSMLDYSFNSVWPARVVQLVTVSMLLPLGAGLFFLKLARIKQKFAFIFIILMTIPLLFVFAKEAYQWIPAYQSFSSQPHYNGTLKAHDVRFSPLINLDQLVEKGQALETQVTLKRG